VKKTWRIPALFLLGVVLGLPLGIYLIQHGYINKEKAIGMLSQEGLADEYAKKAFFHADPESAREALQYAIRIHEQMREINALWGRPEKEDLGWCYAELSVIEESSGNPDLAMNYMTQAEQTLREVGWKDPSEAHIRKAIDRTPASDQSPSGALK
jgi:hypothetical protein